MAENTKFFVGTLSECESLIAKIDNHFGWPYGNTQTYAEPIPHDSDPGQYMVVIDTGKENHKESQAFNTLVRSLLDPREKGQLKNLKKLRDDKAFKPPPILPPFVRVPRPVGPGDPDKWPGKK